MKFTKEIVKIIEDKFDVKLSEKDIDEGDTVVEYITPLSGSNYVVYITRMSVDSIRILVRYKGLSYYFINGTVDVKKFKKVLKNL